MESHLSNSLTFVEIDMDLAATYDFLLVSHSNRGLSRTVSEINGDFGRKSQTFPPLCFVLPS